MGTLALRVLWVRDLLLYAFYIFAVYCVSHMISIQAVGTLLIAPLKGNN